MLKTILKKLNSLSVWEYSLHYAVFHPWKVFIRKSYLRIKWFIQRGYRGYSDYDNWDLHAYLIRWLPDALRTLQWQKTGYPVGLKCRCEWDKILFLIIKGFDAKKRLMELDFEFRNLKEMRKLQRTAKRGMLLFVKYFDSLWD